MKKIVILLSVMLFMVACEKGNEEMKEAKVVVAVYDENGKILGSIIADRNQPDEYETIDWPSHAPAEKVMVIHLVMVCPEAAGKGIGSSLVK